MPTTNYWSLDTESGYNSGAINPTLVARAIRGYRLLLLVATLGLSLWTIVNEFLDRRYVFGFSLSLATIVVSVIALTAMLVSPWTSGPVVLEIAISVALGTTWIVQAGADDYTSTVINVWVAVLAILNAYGGILLIVGIGHHVRARRSPWLRPVHMLGVFAD